MPVLIDGLVTRMREELDEVTIPVIATGGMISRVAQVSRTIEKVYPDLGLRGIADLAVQHWAQEEEIS